MDPAHSISSLLTHGADLANGTAANATLHVPRLWMYYVAVGVEIPAVLVSFILLLATAYIAIARGTCIAVLTCCRRPPKQLRGMGASSEATHRNQARLYTSDCLQIAYSVYNMMASCIAIVNQATPQLDADSAVSSVRNMFMYAMTVLLVLETASLLSIWIAVSAAFDHMLARFGRTELTGPAKSAAQRASRRTRTCLAAWRRILVCAIAFCVLLVFLLFLVCSAIYPLGKYSAALRASAVVARNAATGAVGAVVCAILGFIVVYLGVNFIAGMRRSTRMLLRQSEGTAAQARNLKARIQRQRFLVMRVVAVAVSYAVHIIMVFFGTIALIAVSMNVLSVQADLCAMLLNINDVLLMRGLSSTLLITCISFGFWPHQPSERFMTFVEKIATGSFVREFVRTVVAIDDTDTDETRSQSAESANAQAVQSDAQHRAIATPRDADAPS